MEPKEKAKELIDLFFTAKRLYDDISWEQAKDCAILCVDEIINQLKEMCKPEYTSFWHGDFAGETTDGYELIRYYEEVKKEIELW